MSKNFEYAKEALKLINSIGKEEVNRLFSYEYCELEFDFVGFIENYADLKEIIPKDFTIIDVGCYQAMQAHYFKDHRRFIGIEPYIPAEYCLKQENATYYHQTAQQFISETLPQLVSEGLDLNKVFAVCSAVPDREAQKLVKETFPYHRVTYPGEITVEKMPEIRTEEKALKHMLKNIVRQGQERASKEPDITLD